MFLGTLGTLSNEVSACYGDIVSASTLQAVQSVLGTRSGAAPASIPSMHEAVRLLPPDLFRAALSKVHSYPLALDIHWHWSSPWRGSSPLCVSYGEMHAQQ